MDLRGPQGPNRTAPDPRLSPRSAPFSRRLDSWKEIASYLKRSEKTVRRWEEREALPVHRVLHEKRGSVYAYPQEIEAWLQSRSGVSDDKQDEFIGEPVKELDATTAISPNPDGTGNSAGQLPVVAHRARAIGIAIGALTGILLLVIPVVRAPRSFIREPGRFSEVPLTTLPGNEVEPGFSPDGDQVAFAYSEGSSSPFHIYVKAVGSEQIQPLTFGDVDDRSPSWSPDGQTIAFLRFSSDQQAGVFVIPSGGGTERQLTTISLDTTLQHGDMRVAWSPDGQWLATSDAETPLSSMGLVLISLHTGEKQRLRYEPAAVQGDLGPAFSPDGQSLAFTRHLSPAVADLYVLRLEPLGRQPLHAIAVTSWNRSITSPVWTGDGQELVFAGEEPGTGPGLWRVSAFGLGAVRPVLAGAADRISSLALSRRRNRLAYSKTDTDSNIWQISLSTRFQSEGTGDQSEPVRVIASTGADNMPQYSPDGRFIAFASTRSGDYEIWMANSDGSHPRQLTHLHAKVTAYPRWSPDGRQIVFHSRPSGFANLYVLDVQTGAYRQLTTGATNDMSPSWSHDGNWIYFCSERHGGPQIWRMPAKGGPPEQVTNNGGDIPFDSFDGKHLLYSKFTNPGLWEVPLAGGNEKQIVPSLYSVDSFAIAKEGIYFLSRQKSGAGTAELNLFAESSTTKIAVLNGPMSMGLSVTADGRHLLYSHVDQSGSDLVLMEHFR